MSGSDELREEVESILMHGVELSIIGNPEKELDTATDMLLDKIVEARIDELEKLQMLNTYIEKVHPKLDRIVLTRRNQLVQSLHSTNNSLEEK